MKKLLSAITSRFSSTYRNDSQRYDEEKKIARSSDVKARLALAGSSKTHQEILYYLAEHDEDDAVRKAVAKNRNAPVQASPILAGDSNADVRMALAERLVKILPDLNAERQGQVYAFVVQALGTLALDEVLKIRIALSSALKDHAAAPPKVVNELARDIEREVSEPILKFCTAVSDEVLITILKEHPASWTVKAIAGRKTVSQKISQAVIDTKDKVGGATLIKNKGAEISEATLADIIERAQDYPEWQTHLAGRANLPPKMARRLARFADDSVRKLLMEQQEFDQETVTKIAEIFKRRIDFAAEGEGEKALPPVDRVQKLLKDKKLDEDVVADALGMRDRDFVEAALAALAKTDIVTVKKILDMKAPRPIVALSWQAHLSMRFALRLQKEFGQVPVKELIYPREGTDYPLTHEELVWQLDFFGVKPR